MVRRVLSCLWTLYVLVDEQGEEFQIAYETLKPRPWLPERWNTSLSQPHITNTRQPEIPNRINRLTLARMWRDDPILGAQTWWYSPATRAEGEARTVFFFWENIWPCKTIVTAENETALVTISCRLQRSILHSSSSKNVVSSWRIYYLSILADFDCSVPFRRFVSTCWLRVLHSRAPGLRREIERRIQCGSGFLSNISRVSCTINTSVRARRNPLYTGQHWQAG